MQGEEKVGGVKCVDGLAPSSGVRGRTLGGSETSWVSGTDTTGVQDTTRGSGETSGAVGWGWVDVWIRGFTQQGDPETFTGRWEDF